MKDTSVDRNSLGGSDNHQRVLNDFIQSLATGLKVENGSLQSPHLKELLTGVVTIILPYNNPTIDALAQGKVGLTDGKVLLLNEEAMVERVQELCDQGKGWEEEANRWFRQCLSDVVAAAREETTQHLQAVSSQQLSKAIGDAVERSDWKAALGYDAARFEQKPVLNALALVENDQRQVPAGDLGVGDFNANAANVITALFSPHDPSLLGSVEKRAEINQKFHGAIADKGLHSSSLARLVLVGLGEQAFGLLSKPGQGNLEEAIDFGSEVVESHGRSTVRYNVKEAFSGMTTTPYGLSGFYPSGVFNKPSKKSEKPGM